MNTAPDTPPAATAFEPQGLESSPDPDASLEAGTTDDEKKLSFYESWSISRTLTKGDDQKFEQSWNDEPVVKEIGALLQRTQAFIDNHGPELSFVERIFLSATLRSLNGVFRPASNHRAVTHGNRFFLASVFAIANVLLLSLILFCLVLPLLISFSTNDPDYWVIAIPNRIYLLIQTTHVCVNFLRPRVLWDLFIVRLLGQPLFYLLLFLRWQYGFLDEPLRDVRYLAAAGLVNLVVQMIVTYPVTLLTKMLGLWSIYIAHHPSARVQKDAQEIHTEISRIFPNLDVFLSRFALSRWREKELSFSKFDLKTVRRLMWSKLPEVNRRRAREADSLTWSECAQVFKLWKRTASQKSGDARRKIAAFLTTSTVINIFVTAAFAHSETAFTQNLFFTLYLFSTQAEDCFDAMVTVQEMGTKFCLQGGGQLVMLGSGIPLIFTRPFGIKMFRYLACSIAFTSLGTIFLLTYAEPFMQWQKGWWYRRGVIPNAEGKYRNEVEAREQEREEECRERSRHRTDDGS